MISFKQEYVILSLRCERALLLYKKYYLCILAFLQWHLWWRHRIPKKWKQEAGL